MPRNIFLCDSASLRLGSVNMMYCDELLVSKAALFIPDHLASLSPPADATPAFRALSQPSKLMLTTRSVPANIF